MSHEYNLPEIVLYKWFQPNQPLLHDKKMTNYKKFLEQARLGYKTVYDPISTYVEYVQNKTMPIL